MKYLSKIIEVIKSKTGDLSARLNLLITEDPINVQLYTNILNYIDCADFDYKKYNYQSFSLNKLDLLKKRWEIKQSLPSFNRYLSKTISKLDDSWRRPTGLHNKQRKQIKGKGPLVKVGYRKPKAVRYLNQKGYNNVLVANLNQIPTQNANGMIIIRSTVCLKNRMIIQNEAFKRKIYVMNKLNWRYYLGNELIKT